MSVALMKDEAYVSSSVEYSEPRLCPQPPKVNFNREPIDLNRNGAESECILPAGVHEGRGSTTSMSPTEKFNPASKKSFANMCQKIITSQDNMLSDCDDEIDHSSDEASDISPLLPRSGDELLEDNGQLKPPTELLDYHGKKRCPPELLGSDIRDGRKNRYPPGTRPRFKRRDNMNSKKAGPETTRTSVSDGGKVNESDVFGSSATVKSLPKPTSNVPEKSKVTPGGLKIKVTTSVGDSSLIPKFAKPNL